MTRHSRPQHLVVAGDAEQLINTVEPQSVDLAILDPDYNDWHRLCQSGFLERVYSVMKPTGNVLCFTKQPFDHDLRTYVAPHFRREIIWSFSNGGAWVSGRMPLVSFQKVYWLTMGREFFFNPRTGMDYAPGTKSTQRSNKVFGGYNEPGKPFIKSDDGTWIRDHYHFNKPTAARVFAKPAELLTIFVRCFSPEGGTVLDPFFGSGATGYICIDEGRDIIGFEIDAKAVERFNTKQDTRLI